MEILRVENLTKVYGDEINDFHLSTLKLSYDDAIKEYENCSNTKLGRLVANRELPILKQAMIILSTEKENNMVVV